MPVLQAKRRALNFRLFVLMVTYHRSDVDDVRHDQQSMPPTSPPHPHTRPLVSHQGADANLFPPGTMAAPPASSALPAAKPPASFAQVAAEKAKAPAAASKAAAPASNQQAFKAPASSSGPSSAAAGAPNGTAASQASGQAVLRMRGLP
jgi:hypothetical protein